MSSNDLDPLDEEEKSADDGSEDTPETSNLGDIQSLEEREAGTSQTVVRESRGGISSELDALQEDDELLSTNLHTRRSMHYREDDDDDNDDSFNMHDSFATGDIIQNFSRRDSLEVEEANLTAMVPLEPRLSITMIADDDVDDSPSALVPVAPPSALVVPESSLVPAAMDTHPYAPPASQEVTSTALVPADGDGGDGGGGGGGDDDTGGAMIPVASTSRATGNRALATRERRLVPIVDDAEKKIVVAATDEDLALFKSSHSSLSKTDSGSGTAGWENYDDCTLSSETTDVDKDLTKPTTRKHDDEVSLTREDLYAYRDTPFQTTPEVETVPEDRTVESSVDEWTKPYVEQVSSPEIETVYDDDDSTINTYGSSYWNSAKHEKAFNPDKGGYPAKPETIAEEDEEDPSEDSRGPQKPAKKLDASYNNESWRSSSRSIVSGHSTQSSSADGRSSQSSRTTPGVVQRPGSFRSSRRNASHEVEVSMDGFMHQAKPVGTAVDEYGLPGGMSQPLLNAAMYGDDKLSKFSNIYKFCTLLSIMCLMATITFFAVHVGPFVEQPRGKVSNSGTAGTSQGGETTSEFGALAAGPLMGEDASGAVSANGTTVNAAGEVVGIPYWMSRTFMNWRRNYLGASSELPFIWTHEKTGGDVVAETMSKCLSKVVAGDGKKYDISGAYTASFSQSQFAVLSSSGHAFLNVDLFTPDGIERAGAMSLTQNRVSDLAYTPFLRLAAEKLFEPRAGQVFPEIAGRLLVVFRDPIDRALNRYETARLVTGDDSMTLESFAKAGSQYAENNPLTRELLGIGPTDKLGAQQVKVAQELINHHVFVGLFEKIEDSIMRYEQFFSWYVGGANAEIQQCHKDVWQSFQGGYRINSDYARSDAVGFNLVAAAHTIDRQVVDYARALFELQGNVLSSLAQGGSS